MPRVALSARPRRRSRRPGQEALVPAGEAFSPRQRQDIERTVQTVRQTQRLPGCVYVGELGGEPRAAAERLHAGLGAHADTSVLVAVDPAARRLEIVTGASARRWVDDRTAALVTLTMTSAFAAGDLSGGIVQGVRMLGDHARVPRELAPERR